MTHPAPNGSSATCIAFNCHVATAEVRASFERLRREAPADFDVFFLLSNDQVLGPADGFDGMVQVTLSEILAPDYPLKCQTAGWEMAGNFDLVFLEFARRHASYTHYWFVEYDVHWEGNWSVFFERFRASKAAVIATSLSPIADMPHKLAGLSYPRLVIPPALGQVEAECLKGFLPLCRLSRTLLETLHGAYASGLGGHYEITVPSVAVWAGLAIEDIGGNGVFVRPENRNRFYFANPGSYSHSPGSFVFRPVQTVLRRRNTLWHPVKPSGVPAWHPLRLGGNPVKALLERVKPGIWRAINWLWFAVRWRALTD